MKNIFIKWPIAILFIASNLSLSAQIVKPSTITKKPGNLAVQNIQEKTSNEPLKHSYANGVSNDYLGAATDYQISAAPALSDFRLWFKNGDHKVRAIGVLQDNGGMLAKYSDQNGDDPFRVAAQWINVPGATGGTVTAAGSGTFNIQLPPKPVNTTLVISGFSFERQLGTDNNIRTISIKMDQEKAVAQVSFIDDQREDYRSIIEPTMTSGVLMVVPFGTLVGIGSTGEAVITKMLNDGKSTARPYTATIQYAYIPNSRIKTNGAVSGTGRTSNMQGQIPNRGPIAYRGFVLRFNNSDHHLLGFGIHIHGMTKFPGQLNGAETLPITYQDNNTDDPIQWYVDYSLLQ
ncbi:hypothetical protein [Pedobacter cryotolerans]|uniref:Uncharacterized protein n=1 Tax=Pedobacter cryotolerans TaxID=2571270 RepID=A0A4U1C6X1_9SPHI|nr:hypothetical protein [Pedobacter cryotolerans]TKC01174.1 hypothetical protein FA045_07975 [Pedobacter cryotolerans]